jgi:hypothetical protein
MTWKENVKKNQRLNKQDNKNDLSKFKYQDELDMYNSGKLFTNYDNAYHSNNRVAVQKSLDKILEVVQDKSKHFAVRIKLLSILPLPLNDRTYQTLLELIHDDNIPVNWRSICNNIYRDNNK